MQHLMIDLETLGVRPSSVFLSLAAVQFDIGSGQIASVFHRNISLASAFKHGLTVDDSTLNWWSRQPIKTWAKMWENPQPLEKVLDEFAEWFENNGIEYVWGNGAAFDLAMLSNAYGQIGRQAPWDGWNERCFRTVKKLFPIEFKTKEDLGLEPHNPVHDCIYQIKQLHQILVTRL